MIINKFSQGTLVSLFILLLIPFWVSGQELLKAPKPTHSEVGVPCAELTLVKEIKSNFDEDLFFARPLTIFAGKEYIYVYDSKLVKIFIFNNKYKYVGQFLKQGQGPGEVNPRISASLGFYPAPDGNLYVHDSLNDKLIQFSATGKYLKDTKLWRAAKTLAVFPPVMDKDGFFYAYSINKGIIDRLNPKMEVVNTYLDMNLNNRFVIYRPPIEKKWKVRGIKDPILWLGARRSNTFYDMTADGHLVVFLFRSSTAFIFKEGKLLRHFDVYIDTALPIFQKKAERAYNMQRKLDSRGIIKHALMYLSCFVDKDEPYFYLNFVSDQNIVYIYKFNLQGKLVQVISNPGCSTQIHYKRNGLFYGFSADVHPKLFKIKEDK
jgi:6-bladed beta-propeller